MENQEIQNFIIKSIEAHIAKKKEADKIRKEALDELATFYSLYSHKLDKLIREYSDIHYKTLPYTWGVEKPYGMVNYYHYFYKNDTIHVNWDCSSGDERDFGEFDIPLYFLWDDTALTKFAEQKELELQNLQKEKDNKEKAELEAKIANLQKELNKLK